MSRMRTFFVSLANCQRGGAAVDFALTAPLTLLFIIGGMYISLLGFAATSLHYATEAAARCAAINTTTCSDATTTSTFGGQQFINITGSTPTFTLTTPSCGKQVDGSVTFTFLDGGTKITIPLKASACFPA